MTAPALKALIERWRELAANSHHATMGIGYNACADELEALLSTDGITEPAKRTIYCESCVHLRPFELADDLFTCPVVNIRIHRETATIFGCNFHEAKAPTSSDDLTLPAPSCSCGDEGDDPAMKGR